MYKERIANLLKTIHGKADDPETKDAMLDLVKDGVKKFVRYVNCVCNMEYMIQDIQFRSFDTEEYRQRVQDLDRNRKISHDAAIAAINIIDRMCDSFSIEKVYGGPQERECVGDFCIAIINEYFEGRYQNRVIPHKVAVQMIQSEIEQNESVEMER